MGDPHNKEDVRKAINHVKANSRPPYPCLFCNRQYTSITGALYHLGAVANGNLVPKCTIPGYQAGHTPRGVGRSTPNASSRSQSPATLRKKVRQPLTYEESQRLVEVQLASDYHRIAIEDDLQIEEERGRDSDEEAANSGCYSNPGTPKGSFTPLRSKSSKSKSKSKRRSKMTPTHGGDDPLRPGEAIPLPTVDVEEVDESLLVDAPDRPGAFYRFIEQSPEELDELVEFDMDDEDYQWLAIANEKRKEDGLPTVSQESFEYLMDRFEKECFFESHLTTNPTDNNPYNIDENAVCVICNDGECHNTNAILFCDMCNLAVHQECYGVPYIPEGQWLCRRCMHSPSRVVSCVLCPIRGGAFKQTSDGHWAHMLCALWIPEVQFANPVFLEPIDNIEKIPQARWKLTCYICHRRHGACIQCSSKNCYVAFHVSCAQQKGLYMKVEPCATSESGIRKVAYCSQHSPRRASNSEEQQNCDVDLAGDRDSTDGDQPREKVSSDDDIVARRQSLVSPIVNLPFVPQHRLNRISAKVNIQRKTQFITMLVSFWKLKRQSRNGVPLIRRLQASNQGQRVNMYKLSEEELETLKEQLSIWKRLRHDLERVRMLAELSRLREKQKREMMTVNQQMMELKLRPVLSYMRKIVSNLQKKDPANIFAEPVTIEEASDYFDVIKEPMDFSTMSSKIESNCYLTLEDFEKDFNRVWKNAMTYNDPSTVYYRAAVRIKMEGTRMLKMARENLEQSSIDRASGILQVDLEEMFEEAMSHHPEEEQVTTERPRNEEGPESPTAMEEKLEILQNQLHSCSRLPSNIRSQKKKEIEHEVAQLRKNLKQKRKAAINSSCLDPSILLDILLPSPSRTPRTRKTPTSSNRRPRPEESPPTSSPPISTCNTTSVSRKRQPKAEKVATELKLSSEDDVTITAESSDLKQKDQDDHQKHVPKRRRGRKSSSTVQLPEKALEEAASKNTQNSEVKQQQQEVSSVGKKRTRKRGQDSTDSETNGERLAVVGRGIFTPQSDLCDGVAADTEDHVSEGEAEKRKGPSLRNNTRRLRAGSKKQSWSVWKSQKNIQHYFNKEGKAISPIQQESAAQLNNEVEKVETVQSPPVPAALNEASLTVPQDFRNRKLRGSLKISTTPSKRTLSNRLKQAASKDVTDDEGDQKGKRKRLSGSHSSTDNLPPSPPAKEKNSDHHLSTTDEEGGRSSDESSTSDGANGEHIPFLDLGEQVYEEEDYKHWDVVWAKCPGYPRYPALIVDPRLPRKGIKYFGAPVKCPNDDVFKLKGKTAKDTFLVNFFDARRTWYWLPSAKLEKIGSKPKLDENILKNTPLRNKRSVQQAYRRARQFMQTVEAGRKLELAVQMADKMELKVTPRSEVGQMDAQLDNLAGETKGADPIDERCDSLVNQSDLPRNIPEEDKEEEAFQDCVDGSNNATFTESGDCNQPNPESDSLNKRLSNATSVPDQLQQKSSSCSAQDMDTTLCSDKNCDDQGSFISEAPSVDTIDGQRQVSSVA